MLLTQGGEIPESIGKQAFFNLPDTTPVLVTEIEPSSSEAYPAKEYLLSRKAVSDFTGNEDDRYGLFF